MRRYNVAYETSLESRLYCICDMPLVEAIKVLAKFKTKYLNDDGTPKQYPNGEGYYDISNPRIVFTSDGIYYYTA